MDMRYSKADRDKKYFSSSEAKSGSVQPRHLSKDTGSLSPETKQPEHEADYSLLSVAEVKHGLCHIA
jgi:hypothetical protein